MPGKQSNDTKEPVRTHRYIPLVHPSWRPDADNDRTPAARLRPEDFWKRLGL